jgi:hypothetical protein
MFNLYEILRNAQGGQAIENLAAQFNITPEEADAAVKALVPVLSSEFLKQTSQPLGFGSLVAALGEHQHMAAFSDPAVAQDPATAQKGGDVLRQVLGSQGAHEEIVLRASGATGVSSDLLTQMLPVIASMIFGGLTKSLEHQGFGGILGQLANAAGQGGLGPILGQILGGAPASGQPQPGAMPGPTGGTGGLGSILGQIFGGGRNSTPAGQVPVGQGSLGGLLGSLIFGKLAGRPGAGTATGSAAPSGSPQVPGFDASSIQASLEALTKMLQPGTASPASPGQGGVQAEVSDILSGRRH